MINYNFWLGKKVKVKIDRPIGSKHPKYKKLIYSLNYGYLPGEISKYDGEEIDAYIMGVDKKINSFTGKVIAVIKRKSGDKEFKLVVAKKNYPVAKIRAAVDFQESFFRYEIIQD